MKDEEIKAIVDQTVSTIVSAFDELYASGRRPVGLMIIINSDDIEDKSPGIGIGGDLVTATVGMWSRADMKGAIKAIKENIWDLDCIRVDVTDILEADPELDESEENSEPASKDPLGDFLENSTGEESYDDHFKSQQT